MKNFSKVQTNIDDLHTWMKYRKKLCKTCNATCCSLPVEAKPHDLVRMGVMDDFELQDNMKSIAKRLKKKGIVDHFHWKTDTFTIARRPNGDCIYLGNDTRRCSIYDMRPDTCRNHPHIGPRPGYCAFQPKH